MTWLVTYCIEFVFLILSWKVNFIIVFISLLNILNIIIILLDCHSNDITFYTHSPNSFRLIFPNSQRMNRGGYEMSQLIHACRANEVTDFIVVHEHRGVPDSLVSEQQLIYYFTLSLLVNIVDYVWKWYWITKNTWHNDRWSEQYIIYTLFITIF